MKQYSILYNSTSSLLISVVFVLSIASELNAQERFKFDYILKKNGIYYAVLELPNKEFLVIGTRTLIRKNMKIQRKYGRADQIELVVMLNNGRQQYISGQVMDNGRNTTFYSRSSARQFVRRLRE